MTKGPVDPAAAARGRLRASDADREQVIEELKAAFVQGRLTRDELDLRAAQALTSRTYAELAAVTGAITAAVTAPLPEARPRAEARPRVKARPRARRRPARAHDQPPANTRTLKWGLALATFIVPAVGVVALHTRNQDLFSATIVLLIAYVLTVVIAAVNTVAVRFENELPAESRGQRSDAARAR